MQMELRESYKTFAEEEETIENNDSSKPEVATLSRHSLICKQLLSWKRQICLIIAPLILLPLVFYSQEARCGYVILLMAVFWLSDATHMSTTSLLPVLLYPLLGVVKAREISGFYFEDVNVLLFCGLMVAVAIENCNLHKRIALKVILLVGTEPERLMIGFMLTTAFISMWMSNTATTAMMVPIAEAVIVELENEQETFENTSDNESMQPEDPLLLTKVNSLSKKVSTAIMLSISFSANIGGTMTLTGTGSNVIMAGQLERIFGYEASISFLSWFIFAFPVGLIILCFGWLCLHVMFIGGSLKKLCWCHGCSKNKTPKRSSVIEKEYEKLGTMSFAEKAVLGHFLCLASLWLLRDPKFVSGWSVGFRKGYVSDATAGMLIVLLLFVFPSEKPKIFCWNTKRKVTTPPPPLLSWDVISRKFPWHIVILLGGGFAMAHGAKVSGLSLLIGCKLTLLGNIPTYILSFIVCLLVSVLTEFSSNTGTVTLFLPVVATLAQSINVHSYYLMIPATICSSFAFMFPVATPPNAIVFSTNRVTVREMLKSGIIMDVIGIIVLLIAINTYGKAFFHLDEFPTWARISGNSTQC